VPTNENKTKLSQTRPEKPKLAEPREGEEEPENQGGCGRSFEINTVAKA